jgi:hypothetical protein
LVLPLTLQGCCYHIPTKIDEGYERGLTNLKIAIVQLVATAAAKPANCRVEHAVLAMLQLASQD